MSVNRIPDHDWTHEFNHGGHHSKAWIGLIILLAIGIVSNGAIYCLMLFNSKLRQSSSSFILRILSLQGALFSLSCIAQCASNITIDAFAGRITSCEIQATLHCFFVLFSGCTLCCIAFNSEQKIRNKSTMNNKQILIFHVIAGVITLLISCLTVLVIGKPRIMPGALYCFVSFDEFAGGLLFFGSAAILLVFLVHRYLLIFYLIKAHSTAVAHLYQSSSDTFKEQQWRSTRKMLLYIITYASCGLPILGLTIYERISTHDAPAELYITAAYVLHANSMINSMLYVGMNSMLRVALFDMMGIKQVTHLKQLSSTGPVTPKRVTLSNKSKRDVDSSNKSTLKTKIESKTTLPRRGSINQSINQTKNQSNNKSNIHATSNGRSPRYQNRSVAVVTDRLRIVTSMSLAASSVNPNSSVFYQNRWLSNSPSESLHATPPGYVDDGTSLTLSVRDSPHTRPKISMKWLAPEPVNSIELVRTMQSPPQLSLSRALITPLNLPPV